MKTILYSLTVVCLGATSWASTISSVSTSTGTSYTVAINNATATGANMAATGQNFVISATFDGGPATANCTWVNLSGPDSGCTSAGNFSITMPDGGNSISSTWTLTDLRSNGSGNITSIQLNGVNGLLGFDRCVTSNSGTLVFNDSDPAGGNGNNCTSAPGNGATANSGTGYSAHGVTGGTSSASATAVYSDVLHLASAAPLLDEWGILTLSFQDASGTRFAPGNTFLFQADTDLLTTATANSTVPEPGTFGMIGLVLACVAAAKRRFV